MVEDPWDVATLDLADYLSRVKVTAREPSRAALDELHEAHVRAFTFDNIDVLLGGHPGVGLDAVQQKFVGRGRGGYCFEHTVLFAAALERLGYDIERRLGRVGDPNQAARTHCVIEVRLDGQRLLADPGFGMSLLRPIPMTDGATDDHGGWHYRARRLESPGRGPVWELQRFRDTGWELMHTTDELTVHPIDLLMGHHFTSTYQGSHFTRRLMLARHLDGYHLTVANGAVTRRRPGQPTEHRPLRHGELPSLLGELEVPLTATEQDRLLATVSELE